MGSRQFKILRTKGYQRVGKPFRNSCWRVSIHSASLLVAHGCLDGVQIGMGGIELDYSPAVHMVVQSVFNSDLTIERNELAAMKFLLSTGCRAPPDGDSMLRGSHLLQTVRVLYHVYLTTEFSPKKTTARAALEELVASVFVSVVETDRDEAFEKDAGQLFFEKAIVVPFLVMRSSCKLSMRNSPDRTAVWSVTWASLQAEATICGM